MDARGPTATHVLRKTIVAKMCDLSVPGFRELVSNGAGGLLLLIPAGLGSVTEKCREAILQLEEELLASELDIPVYFAEVCCSALLYKFNSIIEPFFVAFYNFSVKVNHEKATFTNINHPIAGNRGVT